MRGSQRLLVSGDAMNALAQRCVVWFTVLCLGVFAGWAAMQIGALIT
jgi:hypothetical protein